VTSFKKTILLIDDDEIVNIMHQRIIKKSAVPCEVFVELDGASALNLLEKHSVDNIPMPDLIFLDINMPGMGGFEFLDQFHIRYKESETDKRIVMLSSSLSPADRDRALSNPHVHSYSDKTMSPEDFLGLVNRY